MAAVNTPFGLKSVETIVHSFYTRNKTVRGQGRLDGRAKEAPVKSSRCREAMKIKKKRGEEWKMAIK